MIPLPSRACGMTADHFVSALIERRYS